MPEGPYYLEIDLGGTSVKTGVVSAGRDLKASFSVDTSGKDAGRLRKATVSKLSWEAG